MPPLGSIVFPDDSALDIQGHRGARGLSPENTLPAFARALEIGVTTLELDCGITQDDVVVVSHDAALNRDITRDDLGRWLERTGPAIRHLTWAALQRYDVGRIRPRSAYARRFRHQQAVDGARIPRLADLFALVASAGNETVRFNIETKISPLAPDATAAPHAFARALVQEIAAAAMTRRATIQSFDWRTLKIVQEDTPDVASVYLTAESTAPRNVDRASDVSSWTAGFRVRQFGGSIPRMVKAAGGAVWSPYYRELDRATLDEAHALGLGVVVWTVNRESDMRRLIGWGVDGIISDYPDRLRTLAERTKR